MVDESTCDCPVVLQTRVVGFEQLVPNALCDKGLVEPWEAALHARQSAEGVAEVQGLPVGQVVREFRDIVVSPRRGLCVCPEVSED